MSHTSHMTRTGAYGGYRTYVGYNTDDTRCGACFEPVIHGPEQCIVMQMYASETEREGGISDATA